jgi:hypothetical protein
MRAWQGTAILAISGLASLCIAGCGGLDCPAGTVKRGDTCVTADDLNPGEGIIVTEVVDRDSRDESLESDVEGQELPPGDGVDPGPDSSGKDLSTPEVFPGGVIGMACQKLSDCQNETIPDGVCLGWENGYCTLLGCTDAGKSCPEGSLCMGIAIDRPACATTCETDADCRIADGYACKLLPDLAGEMVRICHQVQNQGSPGEGCIGPQDCAGAQGCMTNFKGGYCAVLSCGEGQEPCPEGSVCARVGGKGVCLRSCETGDDCQVPGDWPRGCSELRSAITGDRIKACASGTTGVAVGEQCLNDTECLSTRCWITYVGKCAPENETSPGCARNGDCDLDICIEKTEWSFGFCTSACNISTPCPAPSYCVELLGDGGLLQGTCVVPCGDEGACRAEAGLECKYGDPVSASGRTACVFLAPGDIGSSCVEAADCKSGECLKALGAAHGVCTKTGCADFGRCPFPTTCAQRADSYKCYLRCRSGNDCPPGQSCVTEGATQFCAP